MVRFLLTWELTCSKSRGVGLAYKLPHLDGVKSSFIAPQ